MAIAVPELDHSQEVRMHAMASMLALASIYCLLRRLSAADSSDDFGSGDHAGCCRRGQRKRTDTRAPSLALWFYAVVFATYGVSIF